MKRYSSLSSCSLLIVCAALALVACGKKSGDAKTETQVVAKVNDDEISILQVNNLLARLGPLNEEQGKAASRQVLSRLIDQQLLLQKALQNKLDREPAVAQLIESNRREILAKAYLERQLSRVQKPGDKEIADFYDQHPELFAHRRAYQLQEISVAVGLDKLPEINGAIKNAKGLGDVVAWLKSRNYRYVANSNVRTAEQLPLQLLPKLQQMKIGEVMLVPNDQSINIIQIANSEDQPYDRVQARPMIEQYFLNKHKTEIAKQEMDRLHAAAKIEYKSAFSDMAKADTAQVGAVQAPASQDMAAKDAAAKDVVTKDKPAAPLASPPAVATNNTASDGKASGDDQQHLNNGLTGL